MKVNSKKTQLLCISGRYDSDITSYINTADGRMSSGPQLKILGFTFGTKPNPEAHISKLEDKFRRKIWSIRFLKNAKLRNCELVQLYCAILRPTIEYTAPTYHAMLTEDMSERIEKLQQRVLKIIYGWNVSYRKALEQSGLTTLKERRQVLVDK